MDNKTLMYRNLLPIVLFGLIFVFHVSPMGLSDFWWHMSSGRWIWENLAIPSVDYFTYTVPQDDDLRRVVILQAYYLGQLSFYFVYDWFGVWGLLFYKACLLTLPLWLLWRYLCYKKVDATAVLILISVLPFLFYRFDELRTVIFSFIGVIALLFLIEKFIDRLKSEQPVQHYYWLMPLTMLLWGNLHRGFLIGWVLLLGYLLFETVSLIRNTSELSQAAYKKMLLLFLACILVSLMNPNGIAPIVANQSELAGPFVNVVDEFFSLWKYTRLYGAEFIFYSCAALSVLGAVFMIRCWPRVYPAHALLMTGFIYQGFSTFRFSYFLVVMVLALAAPYYGDLTQKLKSRFPSVLLAIALGAILTLAYFTTQRTALLYGPWEKAYIPDAAADYILDKKLPANVFNAFEFGGYLGWTLYPNYKIFIDQRNLDYPVYEEYGRARNGDYQSIFEKYQVNTVLFFIKQPVLNVVPPIVAKLLYDNNWQVVFVDGKSIVFVRSAMVSGLNVYNKSQVIKSINQFVSQ